MTPGLPLTEVFNTLQGEGPATGQQATFIRFGGCNLSCSWCDSAFTWDATRFDLREEISRRSVDDVLAECTAPNVVLTGGEPLLHQNTDAFATLIRELTKAGKKIHVETNGTIAPNARLRALGSLLVVSPKQHHANADARTGVEPFNPGVLEVFAGLAGVGRSIVKYVVRDVTDCVDAVDAARSVGFPDSAIWLMPEGVTVEALQERWPVVFDFAVRNGVNASHRLHVLAWGEERGH